MHREGVKEQVGVLPGAIQILERIEYNGAHLSTLRVRSCANLVGFASWFRLRRVRERMPQQRALANLPRASQQHHSKVLCEPAERRLCITHAVCRQPSFSLTLNGYRGHQRPIC